MTNQEAQNEIAATLRAVNKIGEGLTAASVAALRSGTENEEQANKVRAAIQQLEAARVALIRAAGEL